MILLPEILRTVLQILQVPLPFASPEATAVPASSRSGARSFHLQRHFTHHPADDQALLFSDRVVSTALGELNRLELQTRPVAVQKPRSRHAFEAARLAGRASTLGFTPSIDWEDDTVQGPGELWESFSASFPPTLQADPDGCLRCRRSRDAAQPSQDDL